MAEFKLNVWRINVRTQTLNLEPVPHTWTRLGGRGLLARILLDEVNATCDPLGPGNKLIFAPGLLVGHMLSSTDRISIGGKSPLTGGIKEANAGGRTGLTAVVVALLFVASLFLAPLAHAVPLYATAPALLFVACLMARSLAEIAWDDVTEAVPAVVTALAIPLTFSIASGIGLGVLTYAAVKLLAGRPREANGAVLMIAAAFAVKLILQ